MVSNMKDIITFSLANDDHEQELKILQSLLKDTGIAASITKYSAGDKTSSILSISYDIDVIRVKKKRNAGRHYVGHVGRYTVCEIKKMQETMTNKEIAKLKKIYDITQIHSKVLPPRHKSSLDLLQRHF